VIGYSISELNLTCLGTHYPGTLTGHRVNKPKLRSIRDMTASPKPQKAYTTSPLMLRSQFHIQRNLRLSSPFIGATSIIKSCNLVNSVMNGTWRPVPPPRPKISCDWTPSPTEVESPGFITHVSPKPAEIIYSPQFSNLGASNPSTASIFPLNRTIHRIFMQVFPGKSVLVILVINWISSSFHVQVGNTNFFRSGKPQDCEFPTFPDLWDLWCLRKQIIWLAYTGVFNPQDGLQLAICLWIGEYAGNPIGLRTIWGWVLRKWVGASENSICRSFHTIVTV